MTDTQWYYQNLGEEFGPVSGGALRDLVDSHQLDGGDLVRESDSDQWQRVDSVELPESDYVDEIPVDEDVLTSLDDIVLGEDNTPKKQRQQWYCQVLGQELGPMSFDDLLERAHSKQLSKNDLVRSDSESNWVQAESIVGLFDHVKEEVLTAPTNVSTVSPQRPVVKKKKVKKASSKSKPKPQKETEERIWFVKVGANELGPLVFSEIQAMGQSGKLNHDDVVRFEGSGGWISVNDFNGVVPDRPTPPPVVTAATPVAPTPTPAAESRPSPPTASPEEPERPAQQSPAASSSNYAGPGANSNNSGGMGGYGSTTSSYGGAAAAASKPSAPSRPTAPSRPAYKPARKSSSSSGGMSFDLSGMFSNLSFDPKAIGAISVIVLVLAWFFVIPNFAGFGDGKYYDQTKEIYDKMVQVGPGKLDTLKAELTPKIDAIRDEIQPVASSKRKLLRTLLDCYKFYFPKAMDGKDEEEQQMYLDRVKRSLEAAEKFM